MNARTVTAMTVTPHTREARGALFVACEDGSLWQRDLGTSDRWRPVPALPTPTDPADATDRADTAERATWYSLALLVRDAELKQRFAEQRPGDATAASDAHTAMLRLRRDITLDTMAVLLADAIKWHEHRYPAPPGGP